MTGTPIRSFAGHDRVSARAALGLPPELPVLLVFGGSQAVRRLNDAVAAALPELVTGAVVLHITGAGGWEEAEARRVALPDALRDRYRPAPFLGEEMTDALVAADLLVGRAGSSTLAEAAAAGLPTVVVPYPHAAGHQEANARELAEAGAARLIADEAFDGEALLDAARLLREPEALARMGAAARAQGRPGAAAANARIVEALASRAALPGDAEIAAIAQGAG